MVSLPRILSVKSHQNVMSPLGRHESWVRRLPGPEAATINRCWSQERRLPRLEATMNQGYTIPKLFNLIV